VLSACSLVAVSVGKVLKLLLERGTDVYAVNGKTQ